MADLDYGEPLFGLLSTFREESEKLREEIDGLRRRLHGSEQREARLQEKIRRDVVQRSSERERLVQWLDRRLAQQEEALRAGYVSQETKHVVEIEVSLLRRYRGIVTDSSHTSGIDDPLMPQPG